MDVKFNELTSKLNQTQYENVNLRKVKKFILTRKQYPHFTKISVGLGI